MSSDWSEPKGWGVFALSVATVASVFFASTAIAEFAPEKSTTPKLEIIEQRQELVNKLNSTSSSAARASALDAIAKTDSLLIKLFGEEGAIDGTTK
jgi:hypothetical protein